MSLKSHPGRSKMKVILGRKRAGLVFTMFLAARGLTRGSCCKMRVQSLWRVRPHVGRNMAAVDGSFIARVTVKAREPAVLAKSSPPQMGRPHCRGDHHPITITA